MLDTIVKTPCIGVCSTGIGDAVCRGCKRFAHEVIHWNSYSPWQKQLIDQRLGGFLSQCVRNKMQVVDTALLVRQLAAQQISYNEGQDEYSWLYSLLKAGATQIVAPEDFGFSVLAGSRNKALTDLRHEIDQEFYLLSQAHYERYIAGRGTAVSYEHG